MKKLNPRTLFLIDGFGALLSAFLLGVVLVKLEDIFGIPKSALYVLAIIPCFFAAYDFFCYAFPQRNKGFHLKIIAVLNVLYCMLSLGMAFHHKEKITVYGWSYIIIEVIIVSTLASIEYRVGTKNSKTSTERN